MTAVSFVVPVYMNNQDNFLDMLEHYNKFMDEIKKEINFVFIDDCSPVPVEIPDHINLNIQIYKVLEDIRWNIPGARNLGVMVAETEKIVLLDVDHHLSEHAAQSCINADLTPREIWKFERYIDNKLIDPHPVTYLMNKRLYLKLHGCDEDFSGNYGSDGHLRACVDHFKCTVLETNLRVDVFRNHGAKEQHKLVRDTTQNKEMMKYKNKDPIARHSKRSLRFSWEFVREITFN